MSRRVGYLVLRYPSLSQAFILREVQALRASGVEVDTTTVWRTQAEALLADADRIEAKNTHALLPPRILPLALANLATAARWPVAYANVTRGALREAPRGLRARLERLASVALAVHCWRRWSRSGVRHVHTHFVGPAADIAAIAIRLGRTVDPSERWSWSLTLHGPVEFFDVEAHGLPARVREADLVACISDFARSQVMAFLPPEHWNKVHVVRCGVDPERFAPAPEPDDAIVEILTLGRLVPFKGHMCLIEAVAELIRRGLPVRLTIVGDGPLRPQLEAAVARAGIGGEVHFAGAVGQDGIRAFYERAHVFCLPSFAEGVPVVLMEAMATGRPVVATRVAGVGELIDDGVEGLLVRPARVDLLVQALERLVRDRDARTTMGRRGVARVRAEYDIRESARQLARHFESV